MLYIFYMFYYTYVYIYIYNVFFIYIFPIILYGIFPIPQHSSALAVIRCCVMSWDQIGRGGITPVACTQPPTGPGWGRRNEFLLQRGGGVPRRRRPVGGRVAAGRRRPEHVRLCAGGGRPDICFYWPLGIFLWVGGTAGET